MALLESSVGCGPQGAGWLVRCLARVDDLYDSTRDRPRGQKGRHEYTAEWAHQATRAQKLQTLILSLLLPLEEAT